MYPDSNSNSSSSYAANQQAALQSQEREEMCSNLAKELPSYSTDYVKRVMQILGTCQKSMESPRYLMGSIHADASSQLDNLKLDFPQQRTSVANKELERIVNKIGVLDGLGEPNDYPSGRFGYLDAAKPVTAYIVDSTKAMRDVLLNQRQ